MKNLERFKPKSLKTKISLLAGILVLTILAFVVITAMEIAENIIINNTKQSIQSMADTHGEMLDQFMNERIGDVRILANNRDLVDQTASVSLKQDTLSHAVEQHGDTYHDIIIVDMDGDLVVASSPSTRDYYGDTNWLNNTIDKKDIYYEYRKS
ncbi:MAG TPA: cache domain-containing protein, partial [Clostridia bacterium]|nr:cache domain-containing protein [Clostridia bacterium]